MIKLMEAPLLALQVRRATEDLGDVVYVHGSTFGADLSVFYVFDGRSWADALNAAGFNVWGFDFAGYGASGRYARHDSIPVGDLRSVQQQLHRVVCAVRERNGGAADVAVTATGASHFPLTALAQYRRFVEDVPRGAPGVVAWAALQCRQRLFA